MEKRKITMTIDDEVFSRFKSTCKSNGMKVSSKVELMMKEFSEFMEKESEEREKKWRNHVNKKQ